jgi:acetyl-CoA C-acetyltransferase
MMASGSVGGVDRDILSTPSAGEHAFVMGVLRVASGQYRTQLVVSWSPTEAHSLAEAERLAADPYFHRRLPLDDLASFALQASALAAKVDGVDATAAALAAAGGGEAGPDPKRWPLTGAMVSAPVTGAVALIIADEAFVTERAAPRPAWIRGMGWATEPGFLGDRDLARAPALDAATAHAYREAGLDSTSPVVSVVETSAPTPYQTLIVLEGLGLSSRDHWSRDVAAGRIGPNGAVKLNPSGGPQAANAVYCTGLISIAEAANQVRGSARRQVEGVDTALAHAASGFAMQYQTVVVLGRQP